MYKLPHFPFFALVRCASISLGPRITTVRRALMVVPTQSPQELEKQDDGQTARTDVNASRHKITFCFVKSPPFLGYYSIIILFSIVAQQITADLLFKTTFTIQFPTVRIGHG